MQAGLQTIALQGIDLQVVRQGTGAPLLLLHGGDGPQSHLPFFQRLTEQLDVIAPIHGHRAAYRAAHAQEPGLDRLAYAALVYVGDSPSTARAGAEKVLWYMTSNKVPAHWSNPPGYHPPAVAAQIMKGTRGGAGIPLVSRLDEQMARGNVFAGTPDQVFAQIKNFWEYAGGFGHLLMMAQAGFLTYAETTASMWLFSQEVYPRLQELTAAYDSEHMQALRAGQPDKEFANLDAFGLEFVR